MGNHTLVQKVLRDVLNRQPTFPRTGIMWDADVVLKCLKKWSPANSLSLQQLAIKVVVLRLLV